MYFLRIDNNVSDSQYVKWEAQQKHEVQDSIDRLQGSLSNLSFRKSLTAEPHRDLVYAEYSVQYQEHLLAEYEYRLWCVQNRLGYSVLMYTNPPKRSQE